MAAEMWYYTSEGKQMDPVSIKELKRLVGDGSLKPTDMVWKDGMPRWIRASSLKELFPDPTSALDQYFTSTKDAERKAQLAGAPPTTTAGNNGPAAASSTSTMAGSAPAADTTKAKPKSAGAEDNDGKPPRRRTEAKSGGGSLGIILMMLVAGVALVGCLFGSVILMVVFLKPGDPKTSIVEEKKEKFSPIDVEETYNVQLAANQKNKKTLGLKKGVSYDVRIVVLESTDPSARSGVVVYHASGAPEVRSKDDLKDPRNYFIRLTPVADGKYDVEVENKTGGNMKVAVTVRETNAPQVKGGDPLPEGVKEGRGNFTTDIIKPGKELVFLFRVKGGREATFAATCLPAKAGTDLVKAGSNINIQVTHETNVNQMYVEDMRPDPHANVRFTRPDTEIIRLRVINAGKTSNKVSIIFNVSP